MALFLWQDLELLYFGNFFMQKNKVFANAVVFSVTGQAGGFGGPSVRELVAMEVYPPFWCLDEIVKYLLADDSPIFGTLSARHYHYWRMEKTLDNNSDDVLELSKE